ncbi:MAG TPA: glycosyltransferase family 4 protein [Burkholderiales bacterium]|nr:glycosyltransferase family 4 protein [Burkholderiales bacterium]
MLWQPALAAFVISLLCVKALISETGRRLALDHPNERSLHDRPVPRTGGLAIVAGVGAGLLVGAPGYAIALSLAAALALLSFLDDLFGLPTAVRLGGHLGAALALVLLELRFPGWAALVLLALALAWYANLYNFMDGSDGLAGGMAVFGFGAYAAAAWIADVRPLATLCLVLAAASAGFLVRNFHPARIFMGDVGSVPLGFLAGALGLIGWNARVWPLWFPLLVFAPFVCDATLTLAKRLLRGERVWQAHREHYYQRLVRMGFGHRGAALIEYAAMLGCGAAAVCACNQGREVQIAVLAASIFVLILVAVWIDLRWARYVRESGSAA